eukprot:1210845-Lingulodinium_polyedra.AAC.1
MTLAKGRGLQTDSAELAKPLAYSKFVVCLRAFIMSPFLSRALKQARAASTYSLRVAVGR